MKMILCTIYYIFTILYIWHVSGPCSSVEWEGTTGLVSACNNPGLQDWLCFYVFPLRALCGCCGYHAFLNSLSIIVSCVFTLDSAVLHKAVIIPEQRIGLGGGVFEWMPLHSHETHWLLTLCLHHWVPDWSHSTDTSLFDPLITMRDDKIEAEGHRVPLLTATPSLTHPLHGFSVINSLE